MRSVVCLGNGGQYALFTFVNSDQFVTLLVVSVRYYISVWFRGFGLDGVL